MCAESERFMSVSCPIIPHNIPMRQGLSLNLDLAWKPARISDPLVSAPNSTELHRGFLCGFGGLNAGPHICAASAFTH